MLSSKLKKFFRPKNGILFICILLFFPSLIISTSLLSGLKLPFAWIMFLIPFILIIYAIISLISSYKLRKKYINVIFLILIILTISLLFASLIRGMDSVTDSYTCNRFEGVCSILPPDTNSTWIENPSFAEGCQEKFTNGHKCYIPTN